MDRCDPKDVLIEMRRPIALRLTVRYAELLMGLMKREQRRRERAVEKSTFVPLPGHYNSDAMRAKVMGELCEDLKTQVESIRKRNQS